MRSLLFVPGDSERKLARSLSCGADILLIDLEDSVASAAKPTARGLSAEFIRAHLSLETRPRLYIRINSLDTAFWEQDLEQVMPAAPEGVLLPKARSGEDVHQLSIALASAESRSGLTHGATRILALTTEVPGSLLHMGSYVGQSSRLDGLTWGAEDLAAQIGSLSNRTPDGQYTSPYRLVRDLCLITAAAAGAAAIDSVYVNFRDPDGLRREAEEAARDGFTAKMAIHPDQVAIINEVFTPSPAEIARAERIVGAFAAAGDAGVVSLDGIMLDRPHLTLARRTLKRAGRSLV
ncbi:MAG: CoA ester lyase [Hyphomicrobiaceae bacterium]|nr:CoA ester lyase [Hyphomicrobiaceae bacterium]